jgi:glycosyltransferase involved in cell wall biosynthesis
MKISVCIATFNGGKYIQSQLESILPQLGPSDEVVISDDSSTDNTLKVIGDFNDSRIKIFPDQHFKSAIFNFENAISKASGEIIFLSDQDDVWTPDKVKVMLPYFENYDLVVSDCYITDENLNIIEDSMFRLNRSSPGIIRNSIKNAYLGCTMAFNRKVLKYALPFPADIPMHDIWLGFVANAFCRVKFIPQKLLYYRRHGGNTVQWESGKIASVYSLREKLRFRFIILKRLLQRKLKMSGK